MCSNVNVNIVPPLELVLEQLLVIPLAIELDYDIKNNNTT